MSEGTAAALTGDNGAASTTSAATTATPGADTSAATQTTATGQTWFNGADELTTGYIQNKGWQNPLEAVKSYQNLEKLMGADKAGNTVVLPKAEATPEEKAAFFDRLGRPSEPTGYSFKFATDEATANVQSKFHELGLTKTQGEAIAQWYTELQQNQMSQSQANKQVAFEQDSLALKQTWGAAHDQKVLEARAAVRSLGLNNEQIDKLADAWGHKATMEFFANLGSKTGEPGFVDGEGTTAFNGAMTPAQAKDQIRTLMADKEFVKQYTSKNAEALAKMDRLHKWAYPE